MVLVLATAGCAYAPVNGLVTFVKWDGSVENQQVKATKIGEACAKSYLGIVALGDASIEKAKTNGSITKVATVDHETTNLYFFYGSYCTIVTGE